MSPTLVLQRTSHNLDNKPAFQVDTNSSDSDLEIGQLWLELALDTMHLFEDTRQGLQLTFDISFLQSTVILFSFDSHRKLMPVIVGQLDISPPNWYLCRCEIVFVQKWVSICDFEGLVFVWELYCLLITNCLLRIDGMSNLELKPSL